MAPFKMVAGRKIYDLTPVKVNGGWKCWTMGKHGSYVQIFVPSKD